MQKIFLTPKMSPINKWHKIQTQIQKMPLKWWQAHLFHSFHLENTFVILSYGLTTQAQQCLSVKRIFYSNIYINHTEGRIRKYIFHHLKANVAVMNTVLVFALIWCGAWAKGIDENVHFRISNLSVIFLENIFCT